MTGVVDQAINLANSPYPPSFDNNPVIFGWALFARLLVQTLSMATIVRIHSRTRAERLPSNHPVYYHRMVTTCFLWGAFTGSTSDVLTYLFWGEGSTGTIAIVLMLSKVLDALTMFPFLMALFVPLWMAWLRSWGILHNAPSIMLNGLINDVRTTWASAYIPLQLLAYSAVGSAAITVGKYLLWVEHGRP